MDLLGRLGGEEFAALLPEVSLDQALDVAERLRAGVEALRVSNPDGEPLRMTVSIGVALRRDAGDDLESLLVPNTVTICRLIASNWPSALHIRAATWP